MKKSVYGIFALMVLFVSGVWAEPAEKTIVSKSRRTFLTVDGRLSEESWKTAESTGPLGFYVQSGIPGTGLNVSVKVCHERYHLYAAFTVMNPAGKPIRAEVTRADGPAGIDDWFGVVISPLFQDRHYQFQINARGTIRDCTWTVGGKEDYQWNAGAVAAVKKEGNGLTIELDIPIGALGDPSHSRGTPWAINFFCRGPEVGGDRWWVNPYPAKEIGVLMFSERFGFYEATVEDIEEELARLPEDKDSNLYATVTAKYEAMKKIRSQLQGRGFSYLRVKTLESEIRKLLAEINQKSRSYFLWQKDIWSEITPDMKVDPKTPDLKELKVLAARNTRASTGFLLTNLGSRTLMGTILYNEGRLPPGTVEYFKAAYVEMKDGKMVPDALVALPACNLIEIPGKTTVLVWIDIDTHGLAAGKYSRAFTFLPSYSGFKPSRFTLNLNVVPVDLGNVKHGQQLYVLNLSAVNQPWYARELVKNGVNIFTLMPFGGVTLDKDENVVKADFSLIDRTTRTLVEAGLPRDQVRYMIEMGCGYVPRTKGFKNTLIAFRDYFLKQGYRYDQFIFKPTDEPYGDPKDPRTLNYIDMETARMVKQVDPKFLTMANTFFRDGDISYYEKYFENRDIIQPHSKNFDEYPSIVKSSQACGKEIWTYTVADKETPADHYRNVFWRTAYYGFSGNNSFWCFDHHSGDPFNSYDAGGPDYGLVYPDPVTQRLIPSRRWRAFYQGIQEFKTIRIIREQVERLKASGKKTEDNQETLNAILGEYANKTVPGIQMDANREKILLLAVELQHR